MHKQQGIFLLALIFFYIVHIPSRAFF